MSEEYLVGLDVGTTLAKSLIFDLEGKIVGYGDREYDVIFPKIGWVETDLEEIWEKTIAAIREAIKSMKINPRDIKGISVTNQRQTVAPVDKNGNPLRKAFSWQDQRAIREIEWITNRIDKTELFQITGLPPGQWYPITKILWSKRRQPKIYEHSYKWLCVHDWIIWKLSGVFATDWSNASETMIFDINKLDWSDKLLDLYKIDRDKLPEARPPGTLIGEITETASKLTGLKKGTPVILGAGDQQCSALGVGNVLPGRFSMCSGTSLVCEAYLEKPVFDRNMLCLTSCHAVPGKYVLEVGNTACGIIYKWFRDNFGYAETEVARNLGKSVYQLLDDEASKIPPGSEGLVVYSYFLGDPGFPYFTSRERGVIMGLLTKHTKSHLARALMEGIAYKARHAIDSVEKVVGRKIREVRHVGGGAKSKLWNSIYADVCGVRIAIPEVTESGALGAAILAGIGCKIYDDIEAITDRLVKMKYTIEPNIKNRDIYDKIYSKVYIHAYDRIAEFNRELARMFTIT